MSYIDNGKSNMMREIYILETENEMLRNQIIKLKIELNELLRNNQPTNAETESKRERIG